MEKQEKEKETEQNKKIMNEKIEKEFKEIEKQLKENTITKDQLYEWFKEELDRKDNMIRKLKKDNEVLFRTALKANEKDIENTKNVEKQ